PQATGTLTPPLSELPRRTRPRTKLGDAPRLTQFAVNLCRLPPGAWSSQRHWHTAGDEFVYVVSGEVVLVTDDGEETLCAGDAAGFRAGDTNASRIARSATPRSSRSGAAFSTTPAITPISTFFCRLRGTPRSTP